MKRGGVSRDPRGGRALYLDCPCGIAGDMLVAALLDLGGRAAETALREALATLPLDGYEVVVSRVSKAGVDCCDFDVRVDGPQAGLDHDMGYLHGSGGPHDRGHGHGAARGHAHEHRCLADIERLIAASHLAPRARALALEAFSIVARAEAEVHGAAVEDVHFHEVGAVDSIVDIVSAAVLLDYLGIGSAIVPELVEGRGTVRCQHGVIPVPAPATLAICSEHGLPLTISRIDGELVTPTGAALAAALHPSSARPAGMRVLAFGHGAGKRAYEVPSILRAMIVEAGDGGPMADDVVKIECDIDDATGEQLAYAADLLRDLGALEVHWIALGTKKCRPGVQLQVICRPGDAPRLEDAILRETTTIGVRRALMRRTVLPREGVELETPWGSVRGKRVELPGGGARISPEHDDVAAIARREGLAYATVRAAADASAAAL